MSGPPRGPGDGRRAADRPDLLHLRGRLRRGDRRRAHAADRRLDARRRRARRPRRCSPPGSPTCSSSASRARLEWHAPWHTDRELSHPVPRQGRRRRGQRAARRARPRRPALPRQRRDRPADGGDRRARPRLPPGPRRREQGEGGRLPHARPRLRAEECIAIGDSIEDLEAAAVGRPLLRASPTAPSATPACARRSPRFANVTVTEGAMGDGFYEAVVSTLAEPTSRAQSRRGAAGRARGCGARSAVGEPRGEAVEAEQPDRAGQRRRARASASTAVEDRPGDHRATAARPRRRGASRAAGVGSWAWRSVSTSPGNTVVTETPVPESSCRSASAKPRSTALVRAVDRGPGEGAKACARGDDTMWPRARSSMCWKRGADRVDRCRAR